jgi:TolB-like protein
MKNILYLFVAVILSSCAIPGPTVTYEKTNASLIQKSIKDLNTLESLKSKINKSDKIVIVGVEDYKTGDYSLLATLEDEIIKEFVSEGYKVLERDNDMVYRLFSEESKNYKHINRVKGAKYGVSAYSKNEDYNSYYLYGNSQASAASISSEIKNYDQEFQSSLQSADKIISYRVIESGIVYDYDEKEAKVAEVEREARTILEVRLTDAKTSEILSAITLDGKANDFVSTQDVAALKDFSYRYYSHTLPKTHGNPTKATVKSAKGNPLPWVMGGLGFIVLISLLAGG